MKAKELQNKSAGELKEILKEMQVKLGKFRFELANKSLKNYSQIKKAKKDIARVLTAIKSLTFENGK